MFPANILHYIRHMVHCHGSTAIWHCSCQRSDEEGTVHDTENLTFSADDRAEIPHISARTISGFRADNQRIPRGHLEDSARTISGFRAEFCGCNTQSRLS